MISPSTRFLDRSSTILLSSITLLGAVLRLLYLSSKSLSLDEGFSVYLARTNSAEFLSTIWHGELNMAPYYALLRMWIHLGSTEFVIRALSVLFGVSTIPVIYFLALRLFGRTAAAFAVLMLALHPFHVALSQTARGYSLAILLVSLSLLFFLRTLDSPSGPNVSAYALFSALAICSQFFAALVILAQWLSLVALRQRRLPWATLLCSAALLTVLLLPLVLFLFHGVHSQIAWVQPLARDQVISALYALTLPQSRCLVYVVFWIGAVAAAIRLPAISTSSWPYWFVALCIAVPFALTVVLSLLQPAMVPRFLSVCIPAVVLFAAAGMEFYKRRFPLVMVLLLVLAVLFSVTSIRFYYRHRDLNEDWRGATEYVVASVRAGDDVIVLPAYARFSFDYYREHAVTQSPPYVVTSSLPEALSGTQPGSIWIIISGFVKDHKEGDAPNFAGYCPKSERNFAGVKVQLLRSCNN